MPAEKKRARGLKNSAANKKAKVADEAVDNFEVPENAQTIVIDKVVEEGDEIGEASALYEEAIEKMETDSTAALALLRGTIHECDRILRNWSSEEPLPAEFYYTYGSALYDLGRLEEDFNPYLDASEERLENGLSHTDKDKHDETSNKLHLALAKVWLAKASDKLADGDAAIPELSTKALDKLEKALEQPDISVKSLVELADIVQSHGDLYNSLESREKFRQWSEKALQKVLEKEPNNATALSELGESYLSLANHWLDQVEGDGDELSPEEKKAHEAILSSKKYFELAKQELEKVSKLTPKILADLAEIYLNEANLISQEEEQEKLYKNAVDSIKEAKALIEANKSDYTLPEGLTTFLVEYEQQ